MFESTGILVLDVKEKKLNVKVDSDIVNLTRALIPDYLKVGLNRQKYEPHITVIREEAWVPDLSLKGIEVKFFYDPRVQIGEVYWWLNVYSDELIEIRKSQNLPELSWAAKPPDSSMCFHITIGNKKNVIF